LGKTESIKSILPTEQNDGKYITIVTKNATIKKSEESVYDNVRKGGIIAINLKENDELVNAISHGEKTDVFIFTKLGKAIRFAELDLRAMGRTTGGVKAMSLKGEDEIIGMEKINSNDEEGWLLIMTEKGYGKKSKLNYYKVQNRGGMGVRVSKVTDKTGLVVGARVVNKTNDEVIAISKGGNIIKVNIKKDIPTLGRDTQGVKVMRLSKDDIVASIAISDKDMEGEEE